MIQISYICSIWRAAILFMPADTTQKGYRRHIELLYPSHPVIQAAVDTHLSAFADYEAARAAQLARQRNEPDEDGFVTVARGAGGRTTPARLEHAQRTAERLKSRQEKMAGGSFYRFQVREKKKERLKALKRGFQEDLKSVEGLRKKIRVSIFLSFHR